MRQSRQAQSDLLDFLSTRCYNLPEQAVTALKGEINDEFNKCHTR